MYPACQRGFKKHNKHDMQHITHYELVQEGYISENGDEREPATLFQGTKQACIDYATMNHFYPNEVYINTVGYEVIQGVNVPTIFNEYPEYIDKLIGVEFKHIKCKICFLQEYTRNADLDSDLHEGFTIGKGKILYWCFVWHSTGNVTCHPKKHGGYPRWITGDTIITVHWK